MKHIRIGVIGVSGRGGLARGWHDPDGRSSIVAGADVNEANLNNFKEHIGGDVFTTTDYKELLARDDIDAVGVFSPDFMHEEHALAVLESGKHIFCEKPLAITVDGCDRIIDTWKKSGKKFLMGFNMRYMPWVCKMKEFVDAGAVGKLEAVWVRHFVPSGGDWYFHDWHATAANTTSLLLQKASHDIDVVHWIAGSHGVRVSGMGKRAFFGGDRPNDLTCDKCDERDTCTDAQPEGSPRQQCAFRQEVDNEDVNHITWELENGVLCSYQHCHFAPHATAGRFYVFLGTEGYVENVIRDGHHHILVKSRKGDGRFDGDHMIERPSGGHDGGDEVIQNEFIEVLLDGVKPTATPIDGRNSVAVGCAGAESLRNGSKPLDIVPLASHLS